MPRCQTASTTRRLDATTRKSPLPEQSVGIERGAEARTQAFPLAAGRWCGARFGAARLIGGANCEGVGDPMHGLPCIPGRRPPGSRPLSCLRLPTRVESDKAWVPYSPLGKHWKAPCRRLCPRHAAGLLVGVAEGSWAWSRLASLDLGRGSGSVWPLRFAVPLARQARRRGAGLCVIAPEVPENSCRLPALRRRGVSGAVNGRARKHPARPGPARPDVMRAGLTARGHSRPSAVGRYT